MKKKVCFIAANDYANCLTEWRNCLNTYSDKYEAKIICFHKHTFKYSSQHDWDIYGSTSEDLESAKNWLLQSDIVIVAEEIGVHCNRGVAEEYSNKGEISNIDEYRSSTLLKIDNLFQIELYGKDKPKKMINFHSGSVYRRQYKPLNYFSFEYQKTFYGPDLYRLGPNKEKDRVVYCTYVSGLSSSQTKKMIDEKFNKEKIIISHTPSNVKNKGTKSINRVVNRVLKNIKNPDRFEYVVKTGVSHDEIIDLKKNSHICIGEFTDQSFDIGGFGVSTIESAAYGNVCLASTYNITEDAVNKANEGVGSKQMKIVDIGNTESYFEKVLTRILSLETDKIKKLANVTYNWYEEYLSPMSVCKKLEYEFEN
jgi:hypothetical protein